MTSAYAHEPALRKVLLLDAATCAGCGALMTLGSTVLAPLSALPTSLLLYAGASLFPISLLMLYVATRALRSLPLVWLVIAGNAAWTLASLWLLFDSGLALTPLGQLFVAFQAAVVALLTGLELRYAPTGAVHVARV